MGRPGFDDSVLSGNGGDDSHDGNGGLSGYLQEGPDSSGTLQASGAPVDGYITGDDTDSGDSQ